MAKMSDVAPVTRYQLVQLASVALAVGRAENVPLTEALRWLRRQVGDGQLSSRLYDVPVHNGGEVVVWSAAGDDGQWKLIEKKAVARQVDADNMPTIAQSRYLHIDDLAQLAASADTSEACRAALLALVGVHQLAPPTAAGTSQSDEPVPAVVAVDDGPLPLTTGDIAFCFDGLRYTEAKWKKPLGNKPKWLVACVAISGQRGVRETRWNPVLIGGALVRAGHVAANSARARFQTKPLLAPWLDAWKTYEADYLDSD